MWTRHFKGKIINILNSGGEFLAIVETRDYTSVYQLNETDGSILKEAKPGKYDVAAIEIQCQDTPNVLLLSKTAYTVLREASCDFDNIHIHIEDSNSVRGYILNKKKLQLNWEMQFQSERIVSTASQSPLQFLPGEIIGDRELAYKYVDSNLIAIATLDSNSDLTVYLINNINGTILQKYQVAKVRPYNIKLLIHENKLFLHYQKLQVPLLESMNSHITVLEFYHRELLTLTDILTDYLQKGITVNEFDSAKSRFIILTSTYVLSIATKNMFISSSKQGVSTKFLMLQSIGNDVYYVPLQSINTRRSTREVLHIDFERTKYEDITLPIYDAMVPLIPESTITNTKELSQINKIDMQKSVYESTGYISIAGNDFYMLEFTADKGFDRLVTATNSIILISFILFAGALIILLRMKTEKQDKIDMFLMN